MTRTGMEGKCISINSKERKNGARENTAGGGVAGARCYPQDPAGRRMLSGAAGLITND